MDVHPEALLISAVVRTQEHQRLAANGITPDMFHVHPDVAEWLTLYVTKHWRTPSKQALKQQFPEFTIYKVDDTQHWCEEVQRSHKRQSIVDFCDAAMDLVDEGDEDAAISLIQTGITQVTTTSMGVRNTFDAFDSWAEVYETVSARVERRSTTGYAGIPTGFATLDDITGGMQAGWFGVIAARLGEGKTWTGIRMAWTAAQAGYKVAYFSLEQSRLQIAMRMHAFASRAYYKTVFNPMDLNRGFGFDLLEYKEFLTKLRADHGTGNFYINDTARGKIGTDTINAVIELQQPDIVFIDYLTLLSNDQDDWRGTAKLSGQVQASSQRYAIPIVALSQVNRLGIGKEPPDAGTLSQADAIGHDADVVMTQKQISKHLMRHRLAKFRHGSGGDMWYSRFSPGTGEYQEINENEAAAVAEADREVD